MKLPLLDILKKFGVYKELKAYETYPWLVYDEDQGISCSAEVRMNASADRIEAEIQFMYDDPANAPLRNPEQIMLMVVHFSGEGIWMPKSLCVKDKMLSDTLGNWEEKGAKFFTACVQSIQMDELPDVDKLIDEELDEDGGGGSGRRGRIGRKSPNINSSALLGMKR